MAIVSPKILRIVGLSALGLGVGFIIYKRITNNILIAKIHEILDKEKGAFGTFEDLKTMPAFNVNFWKKARKARKAGIDRVPLSTKRAKKDIQSIYKALKGWDDEKKVYSVLRKQQAQIQVSMIADYFNRVYNQGLYSYLDSNLSDNEITKVYNIVRRLPKYI